MWIKSYDLNMCGDQMPYACRCTNHLVGYSVFWKDHEKNNNCLWGYFELGFIISGFKFQTWHFTYHPTVSFAHKGLAVKLA